MRALSLDPVVYLLCKKVPLYTYLRTSLMLPSFSYHTCFTSILSFLRSQSAGFSALYLAAQEGHVGICHTLLEAGASPGIKGGTQNLGPLHIAAHKGYKKVCVMLVKFGADIHERDLDGDTPVDLAESPDLRQAMHRMCVCV